MIILVIYEAGMWVDRIRNGDCIGILTKESHKLATAVGDAFVGTG